MPRRSLYEIWHPPWYGYEDLFEEVRYTLSDLTLENLPRSTPWNAAVALANLARRERKLATHCHSWAAGLCWLAGDQDSAFRGFEQVEVGELYGPSVLSLRLHAGVRPRAWELFGMVDPPVTNWGRERLSDLLKEMERRWQAVENWQEIMVGWIEEEGQTNVKLLPKGDTSSAPVHLREGTADTGIREIPFDKSMGAVEYTRNLTREAENSLREAENLPRVGEGWIGETELYHAIQEALPDFDVTHQASPDWLGRQHLDVFLEELSVAVEYHGKQHDQPVEFFGGQDAFGRRQELDQRKRRLCEENGVRLIEVRPGYDLPELIDEIRRMID